VGKERLELARIGSPAEIAEHLVSLAAGLDRGELALGARHRTLRLPPASDVKLALVVRERDERGKLSIEIVWKRRRAAASDLEAPAASRAGSP
jgi:amphi-Trp domain-containing protein